MSQRTFQTMPGGRASEVIGDSNSNGIDFFMPGIKAFMPGSRDRDIFLRILPAFDPNLTEADGAHATSWTDYRIQGGALDRDTQTEEFSAWYFKAVGYPYLGNSKRGILSPKTLEQLGASVSVDDTACPIYDCQQKARNSDNPVWKALTEGEDKRGSDLPFKPTLVCVNALFSTNGKPWEAGIYMMKSTAFIELKKRLSQRLTMGLQPRSSHPIWQNYLFGDVTHPTEGLAAGVSLSQVGTISTYCVNYSRQDGTHVGLQPLPIDASHLAARHVLGSPNTLHIMTYQEIVDWMVQDGFLPHELIQAACGMRASVPQQAPIRYTQESTSFPPAAAPHASAYGPTTQVVMQLNGQQYQNTLSATQQWLAENPQLAPTVLVRPADNSHAFMAPSQSPLFNVGLQSPPQQATGFPGGPAALPAAPAMSQPQQHTPQPPQMPTGGAAPLSLPYTPGMAAPGAAPVPAAGPVGMPASMTMPGNMPPAAAPQMPGAAPAPGWGAGAAGAPAAPAAMGAPSAYAAPGQAVPFASPAAPQIPQAAGDFIPGLAPGNGGPASGPGVPAVAYAADPQPVPTGVPAGTSVALQPLNQDEYNRLAALHQKGQDNLQPMEILDYTTLRQRAITNGQMQA